MSFNHIFGQEKPKQIIKNAIQNNSLAHAYLFYGQESIGKKLIAFELAKTLNCASLNDGEPCSECSSCKKITNNTLFSLATVLIFEKLYCTGLLSDIAAYTYIPLVIFEIEFMTVRHINF